MAETLRAVSSDGDSTAFWAASDFDDVQYELECAAAMARLMAGSEGLEEAAQFAFRGMADHLDALAAKANQRSAKYAAMSKPD